MTGTDVVRRFKAVIPLAVVIAAGCGGKAKADGAAGGGGPPPMPVEVAVAQRDTVTDAIAATGQIEAVQQIELRPDVEGRITEILIREGSEVAEGAALFRIDDAELQAQVARAEAERDLAQQGLTRTRDLLSKKASSQADLEQAEATARSAEASLDLLKVRLQRSTVRAPFGGVVGQRFVSLGDYVTTSSRLVSLHTINPQRATFLVPERYAELLRRGQNVQFQVAALPRRTFEGRVEFIDPIVQLPGRTIMVKALVPNGRRELQPGMFIEARLETEVRPSAVVIPEDAILPLQGITYVWVTADGKATRREVTTGVRTPGYIEIRQGVEAGEQVVVGGVERLQEGAPVAATVVDRTRKTTAE